MILDRLFSRSYTADPEKRRGGIMMGRPAAGVHVDEQNALNYSAVYACQKVIAETISIVSWQVFERENGIRNRIFESPLARLLNVAPNPEMTPKTFKETLAYNALSWGAGYAEIVRNGRGDPVELWPLPSKDTTPRRTESDRLVYEVIQPEGEPVYIPAEDVFAPIGMTLDGITPISPIRMARESISMGLAMERYGASFFGNDARPSVILSHPGTLSDEAISHLRESFSRRHGGAANSWKPEVVEEGMQVNTVGVPPEDAQYLESRKFQVEEIARWYRVPPHKIQSTDNSNYSNIDARERSFITEAVLPWARGFEEEANRKLIKPNQRSRFFTKMNLNTLMRGDVQTRGEFYNTMFNVGAFSPNDIRSFEDMNPVRGGNVRMVPGNMVPLSQAGSQMATQAEDDTPIEEEGEVQSEAMFDVFADVAGRMLGKQHKAVCRAAQKDGFQEWLASFYEQHRTEMIEAFTAPAQSLAKQHGADLPEGVLSRSITEHCRNAVEVIGKADDIEAAAEEWTTDPNALAGQLIEAVSDALPA